VPRKVDDDTAGAALDRSLFSGRPSAGRIRGPPPPHRSRPHRLHRQVAGQISAAGRLARGEHLGDAHILPAAAPAPQTSEKHQHAGAAQQGDEAPHPRRADLPECESSLRLILRSASEPMRTGLRRTATELGLCARTKKRRSAKRREPRLWMTLTRYPQESGAKSLAIFAADVSHSSEILCGGAGRHNKETGQWRALSTRLCRRR
jgi:hypothetical protein